MARTNEKNRPVHMSGAVEPPFWAAWIWNVVHRNAPGAISAMAFTVIPVTVRVRFISPDCVAATVRPPSRTRGKTETCMKPRRGGPHTLLDIVGAATPHRVPHYRRERAFLVC